jgi:hypothetical protein
MFRLKAGADPGIFVRENSMPLRLAFKGEGGSTFGFQRGEGGPILVKWENHFQNPPGIYKIRWNVKIQIEYCKGT